MESKNTYSWQIAVREVFIDLLGTLVPGSLFIIALLYSLFSPIYTLLYGVDASFIETVSNDLKDISLFIKATWIQTTIYFIFLSYFFGAIFFRQDQKEPDRRSFTHLRNKEEKRIRKHKASKKEKVIEKDLAVELQQHVKENLACSTEDDCEFPYPYLPSYLKKRGLSHLLPLAPWELNKDHRTKNRINILKIRLMQNDILRCGAIIRNEAHVRLMCSNWWVARTLLFVSATGVIISLAGMNDYSPNSSIIPPIIVAIIAFLCMKGIVNSLHYQRLREIFYILETAHVLFKSKPEHLNDVFPDYRRI